LGKAIRLKNNRFFWAWISLFLVFFLGFLDFLTGYEISFAFFYLAPVCLAAWYSGRAVGFFISILAAVVWELANHLAGEQFSDWFIPYWNALTRLGFFIVTIVLLLRVKSSLENEKELSRLDHLTGVLNLRAFEEIAASELQRASRSGKPITIAYLDLDNFKELNDVHGHAAGDRALQVIARSILLNIRGNDTIARVGGDEFILLLPETNAEGSRVVVGKLQIFLNSQMEKNNWTIGISFGAVTFLTPSHTVPYMVAAADRAMYSAKRNGKNKAEFVIIRDHPDTGQ